MGAPSGFAFTVRGSAVHITHDGRAATTLRGDAARRFLADVESGDPQLLMARVTGNYRRGNERTARTSGPAGAEPPPAAAIRPGRGTTAPRGPAGE